MGQSWGHALPWFRPLDESSLTRPDQLFLLQAGAPATPSPGLTQMIGRWIETDGWQEKEQLFECSQ